MDGIALLIDRRMRIVAVGRPNWDRFWIDNGGGDPILDPLGGTFTDFIVPGEVRERFRALLGDVLAGHRPAARLDFQCDSPSIRRLMRLTLTPVRLPDRLVAEGKLAEGVLYQSIRIDVEARPPQPLVTAPESLAPAGGAAIVHMCARCSRVAWPPGRASRASSWIGPVDYYRRGGSEHVLLQHGLCPSCLESFMAEDH